MNLICFDLDGTLIDSSEGIYKSLKFACNLNNIQIKPINIFKSYIGPPLDKYLDNIINENTNKKIINKIIQDFRNHHDKYGYKSYNLYSYVIEVLKRIKKAGDKNNKLFIVTNKPFLIAKKSIEFLKIDCFFDGLYAFDSSYEKDISWPNNQERSKSNYLKFIQDRFDYNSKKVFIGDTYSDYEATHNNQFDFIFASYGYGKKFSNIRKNTFSQISSFSEIYNHINFNV